jgi:hypothetical protein
MQADASFWGGKAKPNQFSTWDDEHIKWARKMYEDGIIKAQKLLELYSGQLQKLDGFDQFDATTKGHIQALAKGDMGGWCKNTFSYP